MRKKRLGLVFAPTGGLFRWHGLGYWVQAGRGNIEGRLTIGLQCEDRQVARVSVASSRPLQAPKIFHAKPVADLLSTLPLLYSVCGTAQSCAAVAACEQALGLPGALSGRHARDLLVWFETVKEHLWRILIDWPQLTGQAPAAAGVAQVLQAMKQFRRLLDADGRLMQPGGQPSPVNRVDLEGPLKQLEQLMEQQVFGLPAQAWASLNDAAELFGWAETSQTAAALMIRRLRGNHGVKAGAHGAVALPALEAGFFDAQMGAAQAETFIAAPEYNGRCHETNPYTRMMDQPLIRRLVEEFGAGLLARFVARLLELGGIPARLRSGIESLQQSAGARVRREALEPGVGVGVVEAARGRLVHRVELDRERIKRYQILAPTEWNFHPDGVLANGLMGLRADNEAQLRQQAALWINAIDPCVGYELVISH